MILKIGEYNDNYETVKWHYFEGTNIHVLGTFTERMVENDEGVHVIESDVPSDLLYGMVLHSFTKDFLDEEVNAMREVTVVCIERDEQETTILFDAAGYILNSNGQTIDRI